MYYFISELLRPLNNAVLLHLFGLIVQQCNRGGRAPDNRITPNAIVIANAPALVNFANLKLYHNKKLFPGTRRGGVIIIDYGYKDTYYFLISKIFLIFFVIFFTPLGEHQQQTKLFLREIRFATFSLVGNIIYHLWGERA